MDSQPSYVYLSLFVYVGPEKPQRGVANYVYIIIHTLVYKGEAVNLGVAERNCGKTGFK